MRVLIADDNSAASGWLAVLLQSWGYDPVTVTDGPSALALLRAPDAPHLAVLDWQMPGLNGLDVCREVRKDSGRPYTYVIIVTGRAGPEQRAAFLQAGADEYLVKPADPEELRLRLAAGKRIVTLQAQLLAAQQHLRQQATCDALTGLWNRAMILDVLDRQVARARREGGPLSVIMADLDHFKDVNDTYGHVVGDRVLYQAARQLVTALRPYDTVGRYGGEEFLMVLPGCDEARAAALAERLRWGMAAEPLDGDGQAVNVTLSLGVAAWDATMTSREVLQAADAALYQAKAAGRNRVVHAARRAACRGVQEAAVALSCSH
jgi:diguanylate cyclase (GGDEF)-like protein